MLMGVIGFLWSDGYSEPLLGFPGDTGDLLEAYRVVLPSIV